MLPDTLTATYWAKYSLLKKAKEVFWFTIPETIVFDTATIKKLQIDSIDSIPTWKDGYMLRSSSPFEWGDDGGKLSGVYKSVRVQNREEIIDWIKEIINHNNKDFIVKIHEENAYNEHPLIPIIIQPYIAGKYAGVISKNGKDIFINVAPQNNTWITNGTWWNYLQYIWEVWTHGEIITQITSKYFILSWIIEPIEKLISFYKSDNWVVEFSYTEDDCFVLLQLKEYKNENIVPYTHSMRKSGFFSYEDCFDSIAEIMKDMGYSRDEFFLQQDDHITLYAYLGENRWLEEKLEHIRIGIWKEKVSFEQIREGVKRAVFPKEDSFKEKWLWFFHTFHVGIIFNILSPNDNPIFTKYEYTSHKENRFILYYDRENDHGFDTHEKYFFLQSIRVRDTFALKSTLQTYTKLYRMMSFLVEVGIKDTSFFKEKRRLLKKNLKKYLWILHACKEKWLITDSRIIGRFLGTAEKNYDFYTIASIEILKKIDEKRETGIAYVCHDFEPIFIPYIDLIDLIIISRASINSHAVCIAKEYKKNILFQTRNIDLLNPLDRINLVHSEEETEVIKVTYAH